MEGKQTDSTRIDHEASKLESMHTAMDHPPSLDYLPRFRLHLGPRSWIGSPPLACLDVSQEVAMWQPWYCIAPQYFWRRSGSGVGSSPGSFLFPGRATPGTRPIAKPWMPSLNEEREEATGNQLVSTWPSHCRNPPGSTASSGCGCILGTIIDTFKDRGSTWSGALMVQISLCLNSISDLAYRPSKPLGLCK